MIEPEKQQQAKQLSPAPVQVNQLQPTQVQKVEPITPEKISAIKNQFHQRRKEFEDYIGADLYDRFVDTIVEAYIKNPEIAKCNFDTLVSECKKAAKDKLLPDGKEAVINAYKGTCKYIPMILGLYKMAHRTGMVKEIVVDVVYDCDKFVYERGDNERITHVPDLMVVNRNIIAAYAIVKLNNGGIYREVMSKMEIDKARSVATTKAVWDKWESEQSKKTVFRRLAKRLPIYEQLSVAFEQEDDVPLEETKLDKLEEKTNGTA